jgi:hypothetical protein
MKFIRFLAVARAFAWLAFGGLVFTMAQKEAVAQWVSQSITLNPGWNAVFLELQPANPDCDAVFTNLPVESVWAWNQRFSSVQFIQDASQLVPGQPDWLTYFPPDNAGRAARNLFALQGGRAYLVKLKAGATATIWNIIGQPVVRQIDWIPDSLNFVGFPITAGTSPSFQKFFGGAPAHNGQPMYVLNSSGQWQVISSPASTAIRSGTAYWIYSKGASTFSGPVQLNLEQRDGLVFGRLTTEQTIRIKNNSASLKSITVQALTSQTPPSANFPVLAGSVPLSYYVVDTTNNVFGWVSLPAQLQKLNMQPGEEWLLRLEVNRDQMASFVPPPVYNGVLYQSILRIADDTGVRWLVPVNSEGLVRYSQGAASARPKTGRKTSDPAADPRAGLWIGSAVINKVSQPASLSSPTNPLPVGSPLQFRLIIHVDNAGTPRLLQKVLQMFKEGTLKPDPADPTHNIVDQPGRFVLITDDALVPNFTGATLRDGQPVARRFSSAAFGFLRPIPLTGSGAFGSGAYTCQVVTDYDDPVNPFKHRYHPDHDNLDDRYVNKLPEGAESFTITRQIQLEFTAQDPENLTLSGWGDNQLGGNYRETVSGLHNQPINISGSFRLSRASSVGVLNDGL